MRPAELRGLLISDLDLERKTLSVTGRANTAGKRRSTKTPGRGEPSSLDDDAIEVLREHLEVRAEEERLGAYHPRRGCSSAKRNTLTRRT